MTDTDAPITDIFPEGEIALPRINRPDKTDLPTQEGHPLVRDRIIETFMRGTIPEFHGHLFLRNLGILSCNDVLSSLCIGGKPAGLEGNKHVGMGRVQSTSAVAPRWPHVGKWFPAPAYRTD